MRKLECNKCGKEKEGSYIWESWCADCSNERRKVAKAAKRAAKDLPEWGSGRDPKCKTCRAVKEEPYMNGSLCRQCKLEKAKADYIKKKAEEGTPSRRSGRNPICKCGATKENPDSGFCRLCSNEKKRLLREKNKQDPDWVAAETEKNIARYRDDLEQDMKRLCRKATFSALRKGILKYAPCEVCGIDDSSVQAHHDDYNKPLEVRWLCSWHHAEHHKNEKK